MEKQRGIPKGAWIAAIIVIIVGAALAIYISGVAETESLSLQIGNSPVLGDVNAPVTIYEFSDFSCPFCSAAEGYNEQVMNALKSRKPGWEAPMPAIKENYIETGEVKIVFKYYPGHGTALAAHAVALGLNEQNSTLFWTFAEEAFSLSEGLNDLEEMKTLAEEVGGDLEALNEYIDSGRYEEQLREDIEMATNNSVSGTPLFFINGERVIGAQSFDTFQDIIEEELGR